MQFNKVEVYTYWATGILHSSMFYVTHVEYQQCSDLITKYPILA